MIITKQVLTNYTADLQKAIDEVNAKYGIAMEPLDIRRDREGSFLRIMKVDGHAVTTPKAVVSVEVPVTATSVDPRLQAQMDVWGIAAARNAKGDKLIKFNPNSPKYCFTYESAGGARWKCTAEQAKKRFGAK